MKELLSTPIHIFQSIIDQPLGWMVIAAPIITLACWLIYRYGHLIVPQSKVAAVYTVKDHSFTRLLLPGRHMIIPGLERIRVWISTSLQSVQITGMARTSDNHLISVPVNITYRIDPTAIPPTRVASLIRTLAFNADITISTQVNDCLQIILAPYNLTHLHDARRQSQIRQKLMQLLPNRLAFYGFKIEELNIDPNQLSMGIHETYENWVAAEIESHAEAQSEEPDSPWEAEQVPESRQNQKGYFDSSGWNFPKPDADVTVGKYVM